MTNDSAPRWAFLTNHARVLVCIAEDSGVRLRDISEHVGITERAAHRIVVELVDAGYITRTRNGRRNAYTIQTDLPLPDALARGKRVGDLLAVLASRSDGISREAAPKGNQLGSNRSRARAHRS